MKSLKVLCVFCICLVVATGMACAQGVGASGDIKGTVTDQTGAVVTNATVTATDAAKGTKRTGVTDSEGTYIIPGLSPAIYNVSSQHAGFQTSIQKGVVLNIGESLVLDFHLKVSSGTETVEVTTEPPIVETDKAGQANTITQQYIRDLPIDRRDYLTYTLLMPGVNNSTRLAADQDFRVKQTPQTGLSFYGSNGRGNSVTVDGGEANDDSGGVRLNLSQDAVQEFQINRSNYSADIGGASGASINIVSKSGENTTHGSVYSYFRNDVMDAANPFAIQPSLAPGQVFNPLAPDILGAHIKDTLQREQWGATIGLPVTTDKSWLFFAFENQRADAQNAVPLLTDTSIFRPDNGGTVNGVSRNNQAAIINGLAALPGNPPVPCLTGQPALPAITCANILQGILTVNPAAGPLSAYLINQFENNGGVFPYNTRLYQFSGRFDHVWNDTNQGYLRYNFGHDNEQSPDVQALTGFTRGSHVLALDNTLAGAWFHQFSPKTTNELRLQWNYSNFNVLSNATGTVGLDIPGFANLGSNIFLPSRTIMRRYDFADNFTMIRGHHTFKFGGEFLYRGNHSESDTFFPGRFVFGSLPGGILSPCLQVPAACGLTGVNAATLNALQSAALGLPQFYQQGFGSPTYNYPRPLTALYAQDSWKVRPNLSLNFGVRYELDSQYGALPTDKNNFAPRVSLAWDPFRDHKTVIRAGYGIFYSPVYGQIADVVQTLGLVNGVRQIAQVFVPLTGEPGNPALTSAAIFQTLFAQGKIQCTAPVPGNPSCITPADLTQFGINITHTGPVPPLSVLFSAQPGYQNPYSQQAEIGIERSIFGFSVSASGIYVHTLHLPVALDTNNLATTPTSTVTLANGTPVTFRNWASPQCAVLVNNPCFANLLLLQNDVYSSQGSALYEGGILEVKKRFGSHATVLGSYTYSKAFDTVTDFNSDFAPQDQTNLAGERALSTFDQRHKVVLLGIFDTPWKGNAGLARFFGGFQLSPIFRYNSGHPFTLLAGADVNGDRHSTNDRPLGAARNTGLGPDYIDFDMRLTKKFKIGEKGSLQLIAEGFNLFNRDNFASVNNVVGPNFGLSSGFTTFNVHGNNTGANSPLGFTSAVAPRTMQLGLRFGF